MNPKRYKDILEEVYNEREESADTIKSVLDFYWKDVYHKVTHLEEIEIFLTKIGSLTIKPWRHDDLVKKLSDIVNYLETKVKEKPESEGYKNSLELATQNLENAKKLNEKHQENMDKKAKTRLERYVYLRDLEEQRANIARNQEQADKEGTH